MPVFSSVHLILYTDIGTFQLKKEKVFFVVIFCLFLMKISNTHRAMY